MFAFGLPDLTPYYEGQLLKMSREEREKLIASSPVAKQVWDNYVAKNGAPIDKDAGYDARKEKDKDIQRQYNEDVASGKITPGEAVPIEDHDRYPQGVELQGIDVDEQGNEDRGFSSYGARAENDAAYYTRKKPQYQADYADAKEIRDRTLKFLNSLENGAPSAAEGQLRQGIDASIAAQRAMAAGARGGSRASANRAAMFSSALTNQNAATQAAILRAQEEQANRGLLAQTLAAQQGMDIGRSQFDTSANLKEYGINMDYSKMLAGIADNERARQFANALAWAQYELQKRALEHNIDQSENWFGNIMKDVVGRIATAPFDAMAYAMGKGANMGK